MSLEIMWTDPTLEQTKKEEGDLHPVRGEDGFTMMSSLFTQNHVCDRNVSVFSHNSVESQAMRMKIARTY